MGGSRAASMSWCCSPDRAVPRGTPPCGAAWGTPLLAWASQAGGLRDAAVTGLVPRAGHSTGSGAAAAHSSGVSRLHPPLTPRLILPAPSSHAPDLRADSGRTREEGKRGQDRLDRTLLAFLTKTKTNCTRVLGTSSPVKWDPQPWREGCVSPWAASAQMPVLGNSGREETERRGEASPRSTRSLTIKPAPLTSGASMEHSWLGAPGDAFISSQTEGK